MGLLSVVALGVAAALFFMLHAPGSPLRPTARPLPRPATALPERPVPTPRGGPMPEYGQAAVERVAPPRAELVSLTPRADSIGNTYFIGIYRNIGEVIIERPRAEVVLFDRGGTKVAVGQGYAARAFLLPGEETPISVLIQRTPAYHRAQGEVSPEPLTYPRRRLKLSLSEVRLTMGAYRRRHLKGVIRNDDDAGARFVQIIVLVLDEKKAILGTTASYLPQRLLRPGESAPFDFDLHLVDREPGSFRVDYDAMLDKD